MKYFPTISLTEGGDITMANALRLLTIISTALVLGYALMTFGHHVFEWGGLENLNKPNIVLFFAILGFISIALFLASRFIDKTIYQSIAKYEDFLDLEYKESRKKIRDADLIRKKSINKADAMSERNERAKEELAKSTAEQYALEKEVSDAESEMQENQKTLGHMKKVKSDTKKKIKDTKKQIEIDEKLIIKTRYEMAGLQNMIDNIEAAFREKQEILLPLLEVQKDKSSTLKEKKREFNFLVELIAKTQKNLSASTKELTSLKRKYKAKLKSKDKLDQNSARVQEELTRTLAEFLDLEKQISNYQSIIEEYSIAELSVEDSEKTLELLQKRINKQFSESESTTGKIFET
jgi:chromosome segregation ATPase